MVGMVRKSWFLAVLSSSVIIISFFLLMRATTPTARKAKAAFLSSSPNAVIVTESLAGKLIDVAKVKLESSGYVAIHDGKAALPGALLGYSKLLPEGDHMDVVVGLSKAVSDKDALYAKLYLDNGDGKLDLKTDMPAKDNLGNPVMMMFIVGTAVEGASQVSY